MITKSNVGLIFVFPSFQFDFYFSNDQYHQSFFSFLLYLYKKLHTVVWLKACATR